MQITLLIRCSYRPEGFKKTYNSIPSNVKIICSYDDERALIYIPENIQKIRVFKHADLFFYDNYCNSLKELVTEGYFAFLDEGDTILPHSLQALWPCLKGSNGAICQFSRAGKLKPSLEHIINKQILRGKVGMPCLFLRHDYKNIANFDGSQPAADYHWIKAVSRKINLKFVNIPVVYAAERHNGAMETPS